jgi:hypothetical protein
MLLAIFYCDGIFGCYNLADISLEQEQDDVWTYSWGSTTYMPMKAYKMLISTRQVHPCFSWLWKASAQKKTQGLLLAASKDRLSTRNILRRKNRALPSYDCVLCQLQLEETLEHLLLCCPFASNCWNLLQLTIPAGEPFQVLQSVKTRLNVSFFMDVIIIMSWTIWMARNCFIFRGSYPTLQATQERFFALIILRAK